MERPTIGEPTCHIVLLGPVDESSREQLVRGLQQRFRLTARQAEALLQKSPVVVKKGLTIEKANSLLHRLEEIGARVRIERVFPEQEPAVTPRQKIPPWETMPPKIDEMSPESYCLWEDMENLGFLKAFFGTIWEVLFHPAQFFSRMPVDRGLIRPMIFALVMGVLGGIVGLLYQFLFYQFLTKFFLADVFEAGSFSDFGVPTMIGSAIGLPITTITGVFIISGILHVCLMIVRGNQKGFEATFRVVAYAMSAEIFAIIPIPFFGWLIGFVWTLVIGILGAREAHRISTGRAAFAIFLPILAIFALLAVLAAAMIPIILRIFSEFIGNF